MGRYTPNISNEEFETRLKRINDKQSLAQLAYDVLEASMDYKPQAKLLYGRFEKMLDKGLDINTTVDEMSCVWDIQYGYTDYHLKTARLIFDRCGLPASDCDRESFLGWIQTKVDYDCYNCDYLVRLFLLCSSYMDKVDGLVMKDDIYYEMMDDCYCYTSRQDIKEGSNPMELSYKIFRQIENIDYCVETTEQEFGYYGCWKMHIFDKKSKIKIASYGDE